MKRCSRCNVLVDTNRKICPLCFDVLKKTDDEPMKHSRYPEYALIPTKRSLFLRILWFFTILGIFASVLVNVLTYHESGRLWSIIVILALGYFWILIKSTIISESNVAIRLLVQMIAISAVVIGIDEVTGYQGWSINFVIPFLSMAALIAIILVFLINRFRYSEYSMYLFDAIILGFIPFILWLFHVVDVLWPSLAAASLSFATIVGILMFADRETRDEVKRRFHI